MVLDTGDAKLIIGLLIVILVLFIGFIIAAVFYAFVPIRKIEQRIEETTTKIDNLIARADAFIPQIESVVCKFDPSLPFCPST